MSWDMVNLIIHRSLLRQAVTGPSLAAWAPGTGWSRTFREELFRNPP
jgi:hypothetical protein